MNYIFVLALVLNFLGCKSNSNKLNLNINDSIMYYEDFNFSKLKGVNSIKKYSEDAFIQILSRNDDGITLKIFQKTITPEIDMIFDDSGNCTNCSNVYFETIEEFKKKRQYYYQFENFPEDIPDAKVHIHKYIDCKKNEILLIKLFYINEIPDSYSIKRISLTNNEIETFHSGIKWNEDILNLKFDFDSLRKKSDFFEYSLKRIKPVEQGLLIAYDIKSFRGEDLKKTNTSLYEGFPTKRLNMFWNLYKEYYGSEVPR